MAAMAPALTTASALTTSTEGVAHPSRPPAPHGRDGANVTPMTNGHARVDKLQCSILESNKVVLSAKSLVGFSKISSVTKLCQSQSVTAPHSSAIVAMPATSGGAGDGCHIRVSRSELVASDKFVLSLNGKMQNQRLPRPNGGCIMAVTTVKSSLPSTITTATQHDWSTCVQNRQKDLEARCALLLRRLRRLQSRQAISHVRRQISGFVSQRRGGVEPTVAPPPSVDLHSELLQSRDVKQLSTAALVSLVHKLQSSQPVTLRQHLSNTESTASSTLSSAQLDEDICAELDRAGGHMRTNISHLLSAYDSDATESSSGGESDTEEYYNIADDKAKQNSRLCPHWTWARQRSAVASRWTWLQAQVSDLEYRIRQHNDVYRQIRLAKGVVTLGSPVIHQVVPSSTASTPSPYNVTRVLSNVDSQSSKLTQQLGNAFSPVTPVATDTLSVNSVVVVSDADESPVDGSMAARCRPLRSHRRRRLLRSAGICQLSRKAARLSTVACHCCLHVEPPCVMCGGRYNNVQSAETASVPQCERVALLDPSYHPVLSFKHDIPLSLHFESLLRNVEWQDRNISKPTRPTITKKRPKLVKERVRKYTRRNASAIVLSSAKIRSKYEQKQHTRSSALSAAAGGGTTGAKKCGHEQKCTCRADIKKRKAALHAFDAIRKKSRLGMSQNRSLDDSCTASGRRASWMNSQKSAVAASSSQQAELRRRRMESAFDINNIVIPHSIASATRVEKLRYKEIITPKWHEVPQFDIRHKSDSKAADKMATSDVTMKGDGSTARLNGDVLSNDWSEYHDDVDDEVIAARHMRCELHEKKRFITAYVKNNQKKQRLCPSSETPPHGDTLTPPATPDDPNRQRSGSVSMAVMSPQLRERSISESRLRWTSLSWPSRQFPLCDRAVAELTSAVTTTTRSTSRSISTTSATVVPFTYDDTPPSERMVQSPAHSSSTNSSVIDDDVNDPEWTVQTPPSGILLKLSKR